MDPGEVDRDRGVQQGEPGDEQRGWGSVRSEIGGGGWE